MKKLWIGVVALLLLGAGWFYYSPMWTLKNMRDAAQARDSEKLSEYVDYEALRTDLKSDFRRMMAEEVQKQPDNGFGAIGAAIAMAIVDPMVEALVSPEGVQTMFERQKREDEKSGKPSLAAVGPGEDPVIERQGLDEFHVKGKDGKGAMIFRRHGLGWKLSAVDLPRDPTN